MTRVIDLSGQRFGRLVVLSLSDAPGQPGVTRWDCLCDCGERRTVQSYSLRGGLARSCGCLRSDLASRRRQARVASGVLPKATDAVYRAWCSIISRCTHPATKNYAGYGGRGIGICGRWLRSFDDFASDMGSRPPGTSIDRIDNSRGYEPSNCRWATPAEQARNRSSTVFTADLVNEARGRYEHGQRIASIAKMLGLCPTNTSNVINRRTWKDVP